MAHNFFQGSVDTFKSRDGREDPTDDIKLDN